MLLDARELDRADPLAVFRHHFSLPKDIIYLDGNSLGAMPKAASERAHQVVEQQWGQDLISSWNKHDWINLPQRCAAQIAPLIGAQSEQVICCDSISVNLFKLLSGVLAMQPGRTKVVTTADNFPTDIYVVQGIQHCLGVHRCELVLVDESQIAEVLDDEVAILLLSQVNFRTGKIMDMVGMTDLAHQHGVLTVWDLAHSVGALPIDLDYCNADFAVGCTYKYLNGGPGAPAFMYVANRHQGQFIQPIMGWMGHANPFSFNSGYTPHPLITQNLTGTPAIISMSVLEAALEVWNIVDLKQVREKSIAMGQFMLACMDKLGLLKTLMLSSPKEANLRASHLAFTHDHAYALCQAWIDSGVIGDFRAPNLLRVGFAPLYVSFEDIWFACEKLNHIVNTKVYRDKRYQNRNTVT